ncbi:hypothetical protein A9D60_23260 [Leisingera sp. JC1]|nr:hypothetical protein A9D60_23260 [Leisingera sp. JC1]
MRSHKKAKRRGAILQEARSLFAEQGVDATTMADIAKTVGVSTPTVFNYFGSKDGILIALITEGAQEARDNSKVLAPRTDDNFTSILMTLFMDISVETLEIASKRIWRYAEAASIRHPITELAQSFQQVNDALLDLIEVIVSSYTLTLHDRTHGDPRQVAQIFYDVWTLTFQDLIRSPEMTIETHRDQLRARFEPLCRMIFAPDFLAKPTLA